MTISRLRQTNRPSRSRNNRVRTGRGLDSVKVCLTDWVEHFPPLLVFGLGSRETVWNIHAYMRRLREPSRGDRQSTSYDLESYLVRFWPQS
ncbi:hypothetical protein GCM10022252_22650 [Streptosporangium oxazolinicum]|uniref:Uncharacterized protein n=1 Tax=Streptosporangium oxazolinicum TaxID=909287 RepID=A0ABP8AQG2_9ACTN